MHKRHRTNLLSLLSMVLALLLSGLMPLSVLPPSAQAEEILADGAQIDGNPADETSANSAEAEAAFRAQAAGDTIPTATPAPAVEPEAALTTVSPMSEAEDVSTGGEAGANEAASPGTQDPASPDGSGPEEDITTAAPTDAPDFIVSDGVLINYNGDTPELIIPDDLGIDEIGSYAFAHNSTLRSVRIPDDVQTIGEGAFQDCAALERVVLPDKLRAVGAFAFDGCPLLIAIVTPDSPGLRYCQAAGIPYKALDMSPTDYGGEADVTPELTSPIPPVADDSQNDPTTGFTLPPIFIAPTDNFSDRTPADTATPVTENTVSTNDSNEADFVTEQPSPVPPVADDSQNDPAIEFTLPPILSTPSDLVSGGAAVDVTTAVTDEAEPNIYTGSDEIEVSHSDTTEGEVQGSIELANGDIALGCGEKVTGALKPVLSEGTTGSIRYTSSDFSIVRVDVDGTLYGITPGNAVITAALSSTVKASCNVTVLNAPTSIHFTSDNSPLRVNEARQLTAQVSEGTVGAIRYELTVGSEYASLDGDMLTAVAPGKVTIRAVTYNGIYDTRTIEIITQRRPMTVSPEQVDLCVGQKLKSPVTIDPGDVTEPPYTYKSSDPGIVTVDENGTITGKKAGTAEITISTYNEVSASYAVTVYAAPKSLSIRVNKKLGVGETVTPEIATSTANAKVGSYTLSSSNSKIVKVEGQSITAVAKGTATITAKAFNNVKTSVKLTVSAAPTGLTFISSDAPLGVGMMLTLTAAPGNKGAAGSVRYAITSGQECATLEDTLLTAKAEGEVTVTATAYNGVSVSQTLSIFPAPTALKLSTDSVELSVGQKIKAPVNITADTDAQLTYTYESSDPGIVTVDDSGTITGKKAGTADIIISTYNEVSASYAVTVYAAPKSLSIRVNKKLGVGETVTPEIATSTANAKVGSYTLSSSNSKIIKVDGQNITAMAKGTATITAKAFNNVKTSVKLTVSAAPTELNFTSSDAPLGVGMMLTLTAAPGNKGAAGSVRYAITSGQECATLEDTLLTATAAGEVTVTATAYNGVTATQALSIFPAPTSIQATGTVDLTLGVGEVCQFAPTMQPENALTRFVYTSSDSGVARVDAQGLISCMKAGSAVITVTTHNELSAQLHVQVVEYSTLHHASNIAHRGASGYCRENTLEAFRKAAELGADMIETDVHITKDNELVLYHDNALHAGGNKAISSLTLEQVKKYDPLVPTLDEGLECISALPIGLLIEFKSTDDLTVNLVLDAVDRYGMTDRVAYCSFTSSCMEQVHSLRPNAQVFVLTKKAGDVKTAINSPEKFSYATGLSVAYGLLNADNVKQLHLAGFRICSWTIDDVKTINKHAQFGVDYIVSNYPDRVP